MYDRLFEMPEITVVIPLYNKELYIARALNSVLIQTYQNFEVIIVDDGSSDSGADVVRSFKDPRIRLIQQENQGVSAARNKGIDLAETELIAFLDADDEWLPSFIERILHLRLLFPDAGLYGTAYEVHFPGSVVKRIYNKNEGERILLSYFGSLVEFGSVIFNSSSFAARKEILLEVGGFPLGVKWNEDGTLWGKIALQFPIAYSPDVCSIYHQFSENNSTEITEYLENPFLQYLSTIPKVELMKREDAEYLFDYCDFCRLTAISRNLYSGHIVKARLDLSSVNSQRYIWKKYSLLIISYIPQSGIRLIRKNVIVLSYIKQKILAHLVFRR